MRILLLQTIYPILALGGLANPFWGVVYYTFISVVRPEQFTYGRGHVPGVFAMAIITLLAGCLLRRERLAAAFRERYFVCFVLFLAALYLSTFLSPCTEYGEWKGSFYYLNQLPQIMVFCTCLYAVVLRSPEALRIYLRLLVGFFLFMGVWGIDQYLRGNVLVEHLFGVAVTDRCAITGVFVLYLPLAVYLANGEGMVERVLGTASTAIFGIMIILTQSRAGFLGLCAVVSAMFFYARRKGLFLACGALLLLVGLLFAPDSYYERLSTIGVQDTHGAEEITDHSSASRLLLWRLGLRMVADNPLLGVGNLNFAKASSSYVQDFRDSTDSDLYRYTFGTGQRSLLTHTHNTFLNILVEGGVAAALPYFAMLFMPLWRGHFLNRRLRFQRDRRLDLLNMLNCGIAGYLVTGFFANHIYIDYLYWNLTLSVVVASRLGEAAELQRCREGAGGSAPAAAWAPDGEDAIVPRPPQPGDLLPEGALRKDAGS